MEGNARFDGVLIRNTMLVLNNNQLQLLDGKGIKQRSLVYPSDIHAHGRSFVPVGKVMEAIRCENSTKKSKNSVGRRPPQRVRAYRSNSTNNHELNNTRLELHQNTHLVRLYE